jgi:nitrate/nitrite-specific signal transduction histidine kinase
VIFGLAMSFILRENIAGPVRRLTAVAELIRAGDLAALARVESKDEIGTLAETFNNMTGQLRRTLLQVRKEKKRADDLLNVVIPIGVDLASEKDFNRLLEKMLLEAKSFCRADAGTLYLRTEDKRLKYVIIRDDAQKIALGGTAGQEVPFAPLALYRKDGAPNNRVLAVRAALDGASINIGNADDAKDFDFSSPSESRIYTDSYATSLLAIPLKNSEGQVLGVMQLMNAQDPDTKQIIPFDQNLQQMMESFSSLAVAALEAYIREQSLKQEIQQLRIEIDEVKRQKQVSEIVDTDFFQDLRAKARNLRNRGQRPDSTGSTDQSSQQS